MAKSINKIDLALHRHSRMADKISKSNEFNRMNRMSKFDSNELVREANEEMEEMSEFREYLDSEKISEEIERELYYQYSEFMKYWVWNE